MNKLALLILVAFPTDRPPLLVDLCIVLLVLEALSDLYKIWRR